MYLNITITIIYRLYYTIFNIFYVLSIHILHVPEAINAHSLYIGNNLYYL